MSLTAAENVREQNEISTLQEKLDATNALVKTLSSQLAELKEQVFFSSSSCVVLLFFSSLCFPLFVTCYEDRIWHLALLFALRRIGHCEKLLFAIVS